MATPSSLQGRIDAAYAELDPTLNVGQLTWLLALLERQEDEAWPIQRIADEVFGYFRGDSLYPLEEADQSKAYKEALAVTTWIEKRIEWLDAMQRACRLRIKELGGDS